LILTFMTRPRTVLRLALPPALSVLLLAAAGTLSPASAETYWTFRNDYEGTCLTASTTTGNVWGAACNDSLATRQWHWGNETYTDLQGKKYKRLVSRANGNCLTTDQKTLTNTVWTSRCGSGEQFWKADADVDKIENADGYELRSSSNGDALYTSPYRVVDLYDIEPERFIWWGAHS
jgi:hypothetical protein